MLIRKTNANASPYKHVFIYGDTGSGKTTIAATFPNPLFLVPRNENSVLTLSDMDIDYVVLGESDRGRPVAAMDSMNHILSELEKMASASRAAEAKGDEEKAWELFPYETIVLESLTHYGEQVIDHVSEKRGGKGMDQQGWGLFANHFREVHTRLRGLPCHSVVTSLATTKGEGSAAKGVPFISGSTAEKLPSAMDMIGFLEECETKREKGAPPQKFSRLHLKKYRGNIARVRVARSKRDAVPPYIDNFTFDHLTKIWDV